MRQVDITWSVINTSSNSFYTGKSWHSKQWKRLLLIASEHRQSPSVVCSTKAECPESFHNPLRELHIKWKTPKHKVMNTRYWYLLKVSSQAISHMAHWNICQVITAASTGFILQAYSHFRKGSLPLSQNVILDCISSYLGKKKERKRIKKWLMWVIIFTILARYSTLKILFYPFSFGPLRNKSLGKF